MDASPLDLRQTFETFDELARRIERLETIVARLNKRAQEEHEDAEAMFVSPKR